MYGCGHRPFGVKSFARALTPPGPGSQWSEPMATTTDRGKNGSDAQLDERDARALTQYLTVLDDVDRAKGAEDLFFVVSESGESYLVDVATGACECPDAEYREPEGGCKHFRRCLFATGRRAIPAWIDREPVDPDLGEHVDGEVRFAATDGGSGIIEAGDDGEVLDEESDDEAVVDLSEVYGEAAPDAPDRPEDCECSGSALEVEYDLPCWPCYREGFETPNPAAQEGA